jgi:excisionase family DNA binding protein
MSELFFLTREDDIKKIVNDIVNELKIGEKPIEEKKEERLLTTSEACELLRCSRPTIHRWKKSGIVPFVRLGGNIRYRESDLTELIERKGK